MGFEPFGNHVGYSGLEEESDLLNPPESPQLFIPTTQNESSLIIEMDPVENGQQQSSAAGPSTSSQFQFQSIQLEGQFIALFLTIKIKK
jgi:hypothetical protein